MRTHLPCASSLGSTRPDPFEYLFVLLGILAGVSVPPAISLPGHDPEAGTALAWRQKPDGTVEVLVEWVPILPGYRGGLGKPVQTWFLATQVKRIPGEDYKQVPQTHA